MLADLAWDELRVTLEEAAGIADILPGERAEGHTISHLHNRTNGWMAGLLLCLRHGIPSSELFLPPPQGAPAPEGLPRRLTIFTLGRFELQLNGAPVTFSGKAPKKPLEMLKILLANGGRSIATGVFIEALWPDATGAAAMDSLTTTLQRLRRLLGSEKVVTVHQGEVNLDRRQVWVDAWAFEELLRKARESLPLGDKTGADVMIRQAVALYRGHFLPGDSDKPWSFTCRERLRGKFAHHAGVLCRRLDEQGETHQAIACYRDGLEIDHLSEEFYQQLMLCYYQAGLHAEASVAYHTCRKNLAITLGIAPSPRTEEIYRKIRDHKVR
jgi:two-component SAPR family response regulator